MYFASFVTTNNEANVYLVGCPETKEAIMIDAGSVDPRYKRFLDRNGLHLKKVFVTHDHYDHIESLTTICMRYGEDQVTIYGASLRANWTQVGEGDAIEIGTLKGRVLKTNGHTPDSLSLVIEDRMVFVGDCLFAGSIGGTHTETMKQRELDNIKNKIFPLGDHVEIYPGHGAPTTVGVERTKNPFLI